MTNVIQKRNYWNEDEMASFELGLTLLGKNFYKIHHQHLKSKNVKEIIQFYYKVSVYYVKTIII